MAGDWIKWQKGLARKREVLSVAHKLGMDRRAVAAACMEVWEWADDETADGHIEGVPAGFIDQVVGLDGFAGALAEVGWLRVTEGGVSFPNFDRHNGEPAKQRARNARNQARKRSVTKASPASGDKTYTRDREREEKSADAGASAQPPNPPPGGDVGGAKKPDDAEPPPSLDTERFRQAWREWCQHRRERKQRLTPTAATRALKKLEKMGHDRAIEAIEHSIANGYQGIFEPSRGSAGGASRPPGGAGRPDRPGRLRAPDGKYDGIGTPATQNPPGSGTDPDAGQGPGQGVDSG